MRKINKGIEVPGEPAERRTRCEQGKADQEEVLAAEHGGDPATGAQHDGIGDQVGRHRPGGFVGAHREAARNVAQRHIGDRGVEHFHEGGDRDQHGNDPGVRVTVFALWLAPLAAGSGMAPRSAQGRTVTVGTTDMPGPEFNVGTLVEGNLHRHALHHFHIIAGGVFGRQQAERVAAAGLNAVDAARKPLRPPNASIRMLDGLIDAHIGQLRFLEIGGDPDVERHHDHDRLPGCGQCADGRRQFRHPAVDGCAQLRSLQIGIGGDLSVPWLGRVAPRRWSFARSAHRSAVRPRPWLRWRRQRRPACRWKSEEACCARWTVPAPFCTRSW